MGHATQEANMQIMISILIIEFIIWGGLLVSSINDRKPENKRRRNKK